MISVLAATAFQTRGRQIMHDVVDANGATVYDR